MARYVVTGATGFLGRALVSALAGAGHQPIAAGRMRDPALRADHIEYDLRDRATISNIVEARPAGIFHLAWSSTPGIAEADPGSDAAINVAGTVALMHRLAGTFAGPFVFVSSGGTVYGRAATIPTPEDQPLAPLGAYGIGKATAETYGRHFLARGLALRVARIGNPYGPTQPSGKQQGVIPIFVRRVPRGEALEVWGDSGIVRDYVHVDDAVAALLALMRLPALPENETPAFNIGTGIGTSLTELIELIGEVAGVTPEVVRQPHRGFDVPVSILDASKIRRLTGWAPKLDLAAGVQRLVTAARDASAPLQ